MIKPEMVPEAAWQQASGLWFNGAAWPQIIAAALNAWPGVSTEHREVLNFGNNIDGPIVSAKRFPFLIFPLPQAGGDE